MRFSDESYNLRIKLDTENCEFNAEDIQRLESDLDPLREPVRDFPISDLFLSFIRHPRSHQYRVKVSLVLPGKTLATGDLDERPSVAFRRCVRKLIKKVEAYKYRMSHTGETAKYEEGTRHDVTPTARAGRRSHQSRGRRGRLRGLPRRDLRV